ncbi:hypothetical protein LTR94_034307, partial [Friedmanniomyces endolithicus]
MFLKGKSAIVTGSTSGIGLAIARALAAELDRLNDERRAIEAGVQATAEKIVDRGRQVALVSGEGWHPGVIGIVAGRLKEKLDRPAI